MLGLTTLARYEDRELPRKPQYEEGLIVKGARDYRVECSGCHGSTGRGDGPDTPKLDTQPKDFTRAAFWNKDTIAGMVDVVAKGEAPDMPAFGDRLSAEEILAIARHIEANFRPRTPPSR
jgi:mono/diheme cytochrome c family protein